MAKAALAHWALESLLLYQIFPSPQVSFPGHTNKHLAQSAPFLGFGCGELTDGRIGIKQVEELPAGLR